MHNALAVFYSIFFLFSCATSALVLPQFRLSKPLGPELANKCTFNLWHKQLLTTSTKTNYVQLNEIKDHNNDITIDIAALRPAIERNSYTKISATQVFAVQGLLDNTSLTIKGSNNDDEILFEHDGLYFSSDVMKNSNDAWCLAGAWDNGVESGVGSRERQLRCAFPCEVIEDEDVVGELR